MGQVQVNGSVLTKHRTASGQRMIGTSVSLKSGGQTLLRAQRKGQRTHDSHKGQQPAASYGLGESRWLAGDQPNPPPPPSSSPPRPPPLRFLLLLFSSSSLHLPDLPPLPPSLSPPPPPPPPAPPPPPSSLLLALQAGCLKSTPPQSTPSPVTRY